jgi:hypothetical protein
MQLLGKMAGFTRYDAIFFLKNYILLYRDKAREKHAFS